MANLWWFNTWRLGTFFGGASLLLLGAGYAPDWDVKVSLLIATATFLLMPWFAANAQPRKPLLWPNAAGVAILCSDTTYFLYWGNDPMVDRLVNFPASLSLFLMCWLVWHVLPTIWEERRTPQAAQD